MRFCQQRLGLFHTKRRIPERIRPQQSMRISENPANGIASREDPGNRIIAGSTQLGIDHHAIAHINGGMAAIGDDIARLSFGKASNSPASSGLSAGGSWQGNTHLRIHVLHETGAIPSSWRSTARKIRHLADELVSKRKKGGNTCPIRWSNRSHAAILGKRRTVSTTARLCLSLSCGFSLSLSLFRSSLSSFGVFLGLGLGLRNIKALNATPIGIAFNIGGSGFGENVTLHDIRLRERTRRGRGSLRAVIVRRKSDGSNTHKANRSGNKRSKYGMTFIHQVLHHGQVYNRAATVSPIRSAQRAKHRTTRRRKQNQTISWKIRNTIHASKRRKHIIDCTSCSQTITNEISSECTENR